jgi:hypothetical protein
MDPDTSELLYNARKVDLEKSNLESHVIAFEDNEILVVDANGGSLWEGEGIYDQATGDITDEEGNKIATVDAAMNVKLWSDLDGDKTADRVTKIRHQDGGYTELDYDTAEDDTIPTNPTEQRRYDSNHWIREIVKGGDTVTIEYLNKKGTATNPATAHEIQYTINGEVIKEDCTDVANCRTWASVEENEAVDAAKSQAFWTGIGPMLNDAYDAAMAGRHLSILFGMEDNAWRIAMDRFFVHTVLGSLISGNWEESLCHHYIDRAPAGTMYVVVPDGNNLVGVGAHIEGERSPELPFCEDESGNDIEGPCYFYKISLYLKNPEEPSTAGAAYIQDMDFRAILYGEQTISIFQPEVQRLSPGDKFSRTGSSMVTFYSDKLYDKVCIKFTEPVFTAAGDTVSSVCNSLNPYSGGSTSVPGSGGGGGGGGTSINPNI